MEKKGKGEYLFQVLHPPPCLCTKQLPVKHPITIQDGRVKKLVYLAFHSKIKPALQLPIVHLFYMLLWNNFC